MMATWIPSAAHLEYHTVSAVSVAYGRMEDWRRVLLHVGGMEDLLEAGLCRAVHELERKANLRSSDSRCSYHDVFVLL